MSNSSLITEAEILLIETEVLLAGTEISLYIPYSPRGLEPKKSEEVVTKLLITYISSS